MTDAIRAAVESASSYLAEHPDEAAYTDPAATAVLGDGLHVRVTGPAGELLETDMPAAVGGSGSVASPGWFFRASLAACVASLVGMRAAQLGIEAGRLAFLSGRIPRKSYASASSPMEGLIAAR